MIKMWSQETYESSVSGKCWQFTPYQDGWNKCRALREDQELQNAVHLEGLISPVPDWAVEVVERSINFPPFCPHAAFPRPYLEIVAAIVEEKAPAFLHSCYTVDPVRKKRMVDYIFCLDTWLAGVDPAQVSMVLMARGTPGVNWVRVCEQLWQILGLRTTLKKLLVARLIHRQRWWVKSLVWDGDARDQFLQDQYLGDIHCQGDHYGNPAFRDPYFTELEVPRVKQLEGELEQHCPDWPWFRELIRNSWLCAPKAFRFLERTLYAIGQEKPVISLPDAPLDQPDDVPHFLDCLDTYPNKNEAVSWLGSFYSALAAWSDGKETTLQAAGAPSIHLIPPTLVQRWLACLFLIKLRLINPYDFVSHL